MEAPSVTDFSLTDHAFDATYTEDVANIFENLTVLLCCDLLSVSLDEADGRMLISVVSLRIASASGLPMCVVSLT